MTVALHPSDSSVFGSLYSMTNRAPSPARLGHEIPCASIDEDIDMDSDDALDALSAAMLLEQGAISDSASVFADQPGRGTPGQDTTCNAASPSSETASSARSPAHSSSQERFLIDRTTSAPALLVDTAGVGRYEKPPYSFPCLIGLAFRNSDTGALCVRDIYAYIVKNFPYFLTAKAGWKNSVRHNLSLNKYFKKVERKDGGAKSSLWTVAPMMQDQLDRDIKQCMSRVPARARRIAEPGPSSALAAASGVHSPMRRAATQPVFSSLASGLSSPRAPEVRLPSTPSQYSATPATPRKPHTPAMRSASNAPSPVARQLSFGGTLGSTAPAPSSSLASASASAHALASAPQTHKATASALNPAFAPLASGPGAVDSLAALRATVPTPTAPLLSSPIPPTLFDDDDLFSSAALMQSIDQFFLSSTTSDLDFGVLDGLLDKTW
eukprot:m.234253 g.234253  ORF g.234253 m.234253 type:complete len:439 (+) comp19529_c0_seq1:398-1714(+)